MSFTFDADIKERVRTATDIVEFIGSRYELRRQGRNFACLCPWHRDTRPSLQVNPERQIWKCWVCDIGGDVFNFVMQEEGLTFPEALKKLADRAGIPLSNKPQGGSSHSRSSQGGSGGKSGQGSGGYGSSSKEARDEIYRALTWADEFFHRYLLESDAGVEALKYLESREISAESIKTFGIGLAPDSWSALIDASRSEKLTPYTLEAAGLVRKRERGGHYDFFRNRLMFPVRDREKRVIAFGGRILPGADEGAKYINSPETRVFKKSQQLYGFDLASTTIRQSRQAIVMEGYTDVIVAHQCGVDNAVAVLGTALGQPHVKFLQRSNCDSIILLLDGDEAGQRRSDDVLELFLHAQMDVRVLTLPEGLDPADFLLKHGKPELLERIEAAGDALEFKMRRISQGFDPAQDTHRANHAVEEMLTLLAKVPHSGLISNESFRIRQNQVLPRLARKFLITEDILRQRLTDLRHKQSRFVRRDDPETEPQQRLMRPGDLSPYERELLELIIVAPQVAPIALERVQSGWLECEGARAMLDVYQQLEFSGQSLEFDSVLVSLEDPSLKSLLVTLYEQANAKLGYTKESAEDRLRVLTHRMGEQQDEKRRQSQVSKLQADNLSESEELEVLQDVIRQARLRQGLVDSQSSDTAETEGSNIEATEVARELPSTEQSPPG